MISIRQGSFETNSSSYNCFIIAPGGVSIPKQIRLKDIDVGSDFYFDDNTVLNRISKIYSLACDRGQRESFLEYLRSKGIEIIEEKEEIDERFWAHIFRSEDELDRFLFCDESLYAAGGYMSKFDPDDYENNKKYKDFTFRWTDS